MVKLKRILAVTLVLSLLLSLFSLTANAQGDVTGTVTYAELQKINSTGEFHLEGTLNDFQLGSTKLTVPFTIDAKGKMVSVEAKIYFLNIRVLYLEGKCYIMIPLFRLYADYDLGASVGGTIENLLSRIWSESQYFAQDFYLGETSAAADYAGQTYSMETIIENTQTPSFNAKVYYDSSKQIKAVVAASTTLGRTFDIAVSSLTNDADNSLLTMPMLYFNIAPIVMLILAFFVK